MAHYAQLDNNNIVTRVLVIPNDQEPDETAGQAFCQSIFGPGLYKKTSYNGTIRKNFAGVGYLYDRSRDAFIPPRPSPSWTLNEVTCRWDPPIPYPDDGKYYFWDPVGDKWKEL